MILNAVVFSVVYWVFESFLHAVIWQEGSLLEQLFLPDHHELWMRLLVVSIILLFGLISERLLKRQAQTEERTNNAYVEIRQIFNTAVDGMCVIDAEFNVLRVNETFATLLGLGGNETAGRKCYEVLRGAECHSPQCPLKLIAGGRTRVEFESEKTHANGTGIPCQVTATPFRTSDGKLIGIVENIRDVSERKRAESFIKDVFDSVGEGLAVIDRDFKIITANRAYARMFDLTVEDIVGRRCYQALFRAAAPCHQTGSRCAVSEAFASGRPQTGISTQGEAKGHTVSIETSAYPLRDAAGNITSVIETMTDITEKVKLEGQLRHSQRMESIGKLAGGIAHDFNNILNVIMGYGGLMDLDLPQDDPMRPRLKEIFAASERAARLTQSLLAFSRKQIIKIEPVNVNEIVAGVKKMLSRVIGEDIELVTIQRDKDPIIKADYGQIEQVLMNLAANARDAMPEGGRLTVETSIVELDEGYRRTHGYGEPGRYALLSVADNGGGMDEETRGKIFEPFFTTKDTGKGTGLGLSIVYGIVKQHDGYIDVSSEPGRGSTFNIYLPLVETVIEKIVPVAIPPPAGGTETILLAEDEAHVRQLLKEVLEGAGYTVIAAEDGRDAVRRFAENAQRVQLLLLDVIMPNRNGKEAYEEIVRLKPGVKSIFVSGYTADIVHKKGIYDKEFNYIAKPVRPSDLLRKVREVLDQ